MKEYYARRAPEYDATSWDQLGDEKEDVISVVAALPAVRTLDVACGTGFLTQHLRGELSILDQSVEMLTIAAARVPHAQRVHGDALPLPFESGSFDRVFTSAFYGHLRPPERETFLADARRVASEIVIVEQNGGHREGMEERGDWEIYKVYFSAESLLDELGDAELLHEGETLLVARS